MTGVVIVHDLDCQRAYLCVSPEKAKKGDEAGVKAALDLRDAVTMGKTVYEYSIALNRFIAANGRSWKKLLREAWENGVYPNTHKSDIPSLQRLRNNALPIRGL